jgi:hypothetical protein
MPDGPVGHLFYRIILDNTSSWRTGTSGFVLGFRILHLGHGLEPDRPRIYTTGNWG